jgi:hypothetical protein
VTWIRHSATATRHTSACLSTAVSMAALLVAPSAYAQAPASTPVGTLRSPQLQLVQPPVGGSLPSDRPTVFYRYGPGDATDPIDDASFQLWVDRTERTSGFRVGNGEAWGRLGAERPLSPGAHLVVARVCSVRGICTAANNVVIAVPTAAAPPDDSASTLDRSRTARVKRHNHWKQPQTLIGDLVSTIANLFRH